MPRKIIAIVGDAIIEKDSIKYQMAFETGKTLIDNGYRIQCGGLGGVMAAACMGARASKAYREGDIIGILPGFDVNMANEYVDIPIPTGLDMYRNLIVANASAVVVVGGGSGTLCEVASAWALKRLIIAYSNCPGTSAKTADTRIDARIRYTEIPEDKVYPAASPDEMIKLINQYVDKYKDYHTGITIFN